LQYHLPRAELSFSPEAMTTSIVSTVTAASMGELRVARDPDCVAAQAFVRVAEQTAAQVSTASYRQ
jgi:hypothetical protein